MTDSEDRHERAVKQTYAWAREAAERGEYDEAIAWMGTLEAVEGQLRPDWEAQRERWFDRARDGANGTREGAVSSGRRA